MEAAVPVEITAGEAALFSKRDQESFIDLVRAGGEVRENTLRANVPNAQRLVFLRDAGALCGVSALKNPLAGYRTTIRTGSGVAVDEESFPYELGYVFVSPAARRRGHCKRLVASALEGHDAHALFSTARADNAAMHAVLQQSGFKKAGQAYGGRNAGSRIQLFLRAAG